MATKSVSYAGTKLDTKGQQGFRALVPPSLEGARAAQPPPGHERKKARRRAKGKTSQATPAGLEISPGTTFDFVLPYPPVSGNKAVRHAMGRHYRSEKADDYRTAVKTALASLGLSGSRWQPVTKLHVRLRICPPDEKERDIDNVLKELCDALTKAGFWINDSNRVIRAWQIEWLPSLPQGAVHMTVRGWSP